MPKAPLKAQIIISLFAVLAIAYGLSIARVEQTPNPGHINVVPGQLIVVRMNVISIAPTSSDPGVVAPLPINSSASPRAYFLALKPGRARLSATSKPTCAECLSALVRWTLDVTVWPG